MKTEVLISGAGPTGLVLALWLTKIGIKVRIIDKAEKSGTTSRAIVVHARTLEFYHQMGIDEVALERGIEFKAMNLWLNGKKVARLPFGNIGAEISRYPYALIFPQDLHEEMLVQQLESAGVRIDRNTELVDFETAENGINVHLRKQDEKQEHCAVHYLAACDGAHSIIREKLAVGFPGGTYESTFYVADIEASGPITDGEMHTALDDADFLAIFPMKGNGRIRLVGNVVPGANGKKQLDWEDVSQGIVRRLQMNVDEVRWFSSYRVHHRVASHFRKGNIFLLGDAAHIHSPVGGQGMNTGIGDAVNLAWKLAAVIKGTSTGALMDTYEPERIAFANKLVKTTDRVFAFITNKSNFARQVRLKIIPYLLPRLFSFSFIRRFVFRTVSQTSIRYNKSPLSSGIAGKIKGGDRLPWVGTGVKNGLDNDNFSSLKSMEWQIHCYGKESQELHQLCENKNIALHVFPWHPAFTKAGLKENAVYVVRPDGYVGLVLRNQDHKKLNNYLNKWIIERL